MWFGTSKRRKVIHVEIEKQMFGRHVCWPSLTNAVRIFSKDIDQMGLARSFPVYHTFVHIKQQLLMMIPPFLEQLLDLNSSRQLEGR